MTRKKFVKKLNYLYVQMIRVGKELGQDPNLVRSCCLIRARDYKLPQGMTYQQVWDDLVSICGDSYGIK